MFLAGSTNPRPKWFVRKLAALQREHTDLKDGVNSWLQSAQHTELQKREAIEVACELIDLTYAHARELLGTNPHYFSVEEALELTEREFAGRAVQDRDTETELRLRRRMFAPAGRPLMIELLNQAGRHPRIDLAHAPAP
jgi:hypothetical protein